MVARGGHLGAAGDLRTAAGRGEPARERVTGAGRRGEGTIGAVIGHRFAGGRHGTAAGIVSHRIGIGLPYRVQRHILVFRVAAAGLVFRTGGRSGRGPALEGVTRAGSLFDDSVKLTVCFFVWFPGILLTLADVFAL